MWEGETDEVHSKKHAVVSEQKHAPPRQDLWLTVIDGILPSWQDSFPDVV